MSDQKISEHEQEMIAMAEKVEIEGDPLTKAWWREWMRIRALIDREPWEELLVDLTIELEPTMNKISHSRRLNRYDRFLIDVLQLLVLPNPHDPQGDRDRVVAMCVNKRRCAGDRAPQKRWKAFHRIEVENYAPGIA